MLDAAASDVAWSWYKLFANGDPHIFPRTEAQYRQLLDAGRVISATEAGEVLGLTYFTLGENEESGENEWELGGLMVGESHRNRGLGTALAHVALGHLLFDEDPFSRGECVISHVHKENQAPRNLLHRLGFRRRRAVAIAGEKLPGLKTNDAGMVEGDELELARAGLTDLSTWCRDWPHHLRDDSPAKIELGDAVTLEDWRTAFDQMAAE